MPERSLEPRDKCGDQPVTLRERLVHTVALFPSPADDEYAIVGTANVYGQGVRTGITWGDLRQIASVIR